jgi:uncharacterized membrane protein YkvA (DUF1232 family)
MGIKFEFELEDQDLRYFQNIIESNGPSRPDLDVEDVIKATRELLERARRASTPKFILAMLEQLGPLADMVTDRDWQLPESDAERVRAALAYFSDPEDLIPDDVPAFGYLDDAVIVELACRHLRQELDAYHDFCRYRKEESERRGKAGESIAVSRQEWLEAKRMELRENPHSRRNIFGRKKE